MSSASIPSRTLHHLKLWPEICGEPINGGATSGTGSSIGSRKRRKSSRFSGSGRTTSDSKLPLHPKRCEEPQPRALRHFNLAVGKYRVRVRWLDRSAIFGMFSILGDVERSDVMKIFDWFRGFKKAESSTQLVVERMPGYLWVRLVDLPGYQEWAADYDRLERIIPDLENYGRLMPQAEVENPPQGYFEKVFQGSLDDFQEQFAHLDPPRHVIADYRKGGKFYKNDT